MADKNGREPLQVGLCSPCLLRRVHLSEPLMWFSYFYKWKWWLRAQFISYDIPFLKTCWNTQGGCLVFWVFFTFSMGRAFANPARLHWNKLPLQICMEGSFHILKRSLKPIFLPLFSSLIVSLIWINIQLISTFINSELISITVAVFIFFIS